jgi:VanZ family protein
MPRKYILIVACLLLAFVVFATLSPIHLRPKTGHPNLERFAAFLILGAAYTLALPRRAGLVAVCMVVGAFALEAAQGWAPTRDPDVNDALVKALGALLGVAIARLADVGLERLRAGRDGSQRPP